MAELPYFAFYPRDWLAAPEVMGMTLEQRGAYIHLLAVAWQGDGLPNDPEWLARALGVDRASLDRLWPVLAPYFPVNGDGRRRNPRQEEERQISRELHAKRCAAGRLGGRPRDGEKQTESKPKANKKPGLSKTGSKTEAGLKQAEAEVQPEIEPKTDVPPADAGVPTLPAEVVALWNDDPKRTGLPAVSQLTSARQVTLRARLREHPHHAWWRDYFARLWASDFLMGRRGRDEAHANWRPTFDWALKPATITKIVEGIYDNRTQTTVSRDPPPVSPAAAAWAAAVEAKVTKRDWFDHLKPCRVVADTGEVLTVQAPTGEQAYYVAKHFRTILDIAGTEVGRQVAVTSAEGGG